MNEDKDNLIKKFTNKLAFQLKPSNDTMEAIRLFRQELPSLISQSNKALLTKLRGEIEGDKEVFVNENGCEGITKDGWCCPKHKFYILAKDQDIALIDKYLEQ